MVKRLGQPQQSSQAELESLDIIKRNACGIDIGARSHWVSVPPGQDTQPVREFGCYTPDLLCLDKWVRLAINAQGISSIFNSVLLLQQVAHRWELEPDSRSVSGVGESRSRPRFES